MSDSTYLARRQLGIERIAGLMRAEASRFCASSREEAGLRAGKHRLIDRFGGAQQFEVMSRRLDLRLPVTATEEWRRHRMSRRHRGVIHGVLLSSTREAGEKHDAGASAGN